MSPQEYTREKYNRFELVSWTNKGHTIERKKDMMSSSQIVFFFILLPVLLIFGVADAEKGKSKEYKLVVNGIERSYILYKPLCTNSRELPLMIVLHGGLGNAKHVQEVTGMNEVAKTGKFIVAYPNGIGGRFRFTKNRRTWNAGDCCGNAVRKNVNDILFIEKLIDDIDSKFSIDTRRVYVTGMSNGAMMAYRLACEIPDKIAAIIPVAGALTVDNFDNAKDIPVLHIHGDQDPNVPISGGKGPMSLAGVSFRPLRDTVKLITRSRHCRTSEKKILNGGIEVSSYRCTNGAPVEIFIIKGGKHVWPGGRRRNNSSPDDQYISASKQAWEFAKQFSKRYETKR
ncbi:MAG: PHB depolymerase family esterase [Thermodesulfobacteriota bacterium]|nr:PHB depolymerase family esterase [Thermodesulfobacteriota bacterium]